MSLYEGEWEAVWSVYLPICQCTVKPSLSICLFSAVRVSWLAGSSFSSWANYQSVSHCFIYLDSNTISKIKTFISYLLFYFFLINRRVVLKKFLFPNYHYGTPLISEKIWKAKFQNYCLLALKTESHIPYLQILSGNTKMLQVRLN